MKNLIILKLGGSVLTFKDQPFKPNLENIKRISEEIFEALSSSETKLILVHGAGSFGHQLVLKSGIHLGIRNEKQLISFAEVQSWQNLWNFIITKALQKKGLPAIPFQPSASAIVEKGKIVSISLNLIKRFLETGLIPVLYGVPAYDPTQKCSILSGDEIVAYLAVKLKAKKVIHGTNVDGIFTDDPLKNPSAKLIEEINQKNLGKVLNLLKESSGIDATGGMYWKVFRLIEVAKKGIECLIINANKPGLIKESLKCKPVKGTKISLY